MTTTPHGTLEYLPQADLHTDRNVRADLNLDRDFLASIRDHGVIVPIVAIRTPDGVQVRAGHRRTAAAHATGLDTVPVLVIDPDTSDDETGRIVTQLVENHHRAALTTADTLHAVQQLALLGTTPAAIARRTKIGRDTVNAALAAVDSDLGRRAAAEVPELTIEHLGWLAEFDDDEHQSSMLLEVFTHRPDQARHAVERARQARAEHHAEQQAHTLIAEAHPDTRPLTSVYDTPGVAYLTRLADPHGNPLTADDHTGCPGDAYILTIDRWADPDTADSPESLTVDGLVFRIQWACDQWAAHGHTDRWASHTPNPDTGDQAQDRAEAARAQRRRTIILNKAGDAAQAVRREWLTTFTTRKTAPKDAAAFLLAGLANSHPAAGHEAHLGITKVADLLGETDLPAWAATQTPARVAQINLCARLWAYEARTDKSIWRDGRTYGHYLTALSQWGYDLSEPEQVAAGNLTQEQAVTLLTDNPQ